MMSNLTPAKEFSKTIGFSGRLGPYSVSQVKACIISATSISEYQDL
jgi:hypothetical protein